MATKPTTASLTSEVEALKAIVSSLAALVSAQTDEVAALRAKVADLEASRDGMRTWARQVKAALAAKPQGSRPRGITPEQEEYNRAQNARRAAEKATRAAAKAAKDLGPEDGEECPDLL